MADLQNNTEYGGKSNINPAAAYSAARKAILSRFGASGTPPQQTTGWQGQGTTKISNRDEKGNPIANLPFAMPTVTQQQPQYAAPQTYKNLGTGQQVQSYVPPDYQTAPAAPGKYTSPSDVQNLRFRNLPENLGAGQYVVDTEQPGQMIRSKRGVRPDQFEGSNTEYASDTVDSMNKVILGGAKSAGSKSYGMGFQIDHIVPLWLGGADTAENRQLLDPYTHEKKTKIQAVALTLLQAKKINTDQAKMMAIRWKEHDDSGINPLNNGFADLKNAEEVAKRWQTEEAQVKPVKWSSFWNELKNLKNFGQETLGTSAPAGFIREFVKGGASTLSFGYIPYEMDDDYKGGAAKVSAMAGNVAGNLLGFIPAIKGIGMLFGGMSVGLRNIGVMAKIADAGTKGFASPIGNAMISKIGLSKTVGTGLKTLATEAPGLGGSSKLMLALKQAGLFTTYGQLSREGLLGQSITGEENHWGERFLWDAVSGGAMGKWSNPSTAAKDALKVAGLSTTLDAMLRADDPNWTIESSVMNGMTIGGIHYVGLKAGGGITPNTIRQNVSGKMTDEARSGLFAAAKYNPTLKAELQKATGLDVEVIEKQVEKAHGEMLKKIAATKKDGQDINDIDFTEATNNYTRNLFAARQMYIANLPPSQQHAARLEDLSSMTRHLYKNEPVEDKALYAVRDAGEKLDASLPKSSVNLATDKQAADALAQSGVVRIPLSGTDVDVKIKLNIKQAEQLNKESRLGGEGFLVRDPAQGALINAGTGGKYKNPENHVVAVVPYYTDKTKTSLEGFLRIGYLPETSYVERLNSGKTKFNDFDTAKANKDVVGSDMLANGESVKRFDLEWQSSETIGGRSSAVIQLRPDASERSKIFNDAFASRVKERTINETTSNIDENRMREAGMPVDFMNTIVSDFKVALATGDPERLVSTINGNWGKNTITVDVAKQILDNPTYTIGDMLDLVKKSVKWKRASYFLDDQMSPSKEAASAYKEYRNTNIKTHKMPEEIKTELPQDLAKTISETKTTQPAPVEKPFPEQVVTLGGEDLGGPARPAVKYPPARPKVAKKEVVASDTKVSPKSISGALKAAIQAVQESPLANKNVQAKVPPQAPKMPQIAQKEPTRPLGQVSQTNAPTGQNTPISRTPQTVSETPVTVKPTLTKMPSKTADAEPITASGTKELDRYDIKRMQSEDAPFDRKETQTLVEKAFNPKIKREMEESLENTGEAAAVKILRAAGEENVRTTPEGNVFIDPKSKLTGTILRERTGLSQFEFLDGVDYMSSTVAEVKSRGTAPGRVLGDIVFRGEKRPDAKISDTPKGKKVTYMDNDWKTGQMKEKVSYPGSGTTDWMADKAMKAAKSIREKKPLNYEDGLATGFTKAIEKITGKSVSPSNLSKQFGVDGFFAKLSEKAKAKTDYNDREVTQPRYAQKSRVEQERNRLGEIPQETREKLFRKRLEEEEIAREEKATSDEDISSEFPKYKTVNSEKDPDGFVSLDLLEGPQMGKGVDIDQGGTFGLRMEDRSQSLKENLPISELEYSLPGMALRTAGEKVNVVDGLKDGLMLAKQFRDHFQFVSKQKPKFVDFLELEKEIRGAYDPEFKKILPLMKKSELRRVSKAIMQKTAPEGTVIKVEGNPAFEKPASPRVDIKEMIKKHDGANPEGSTKIMETILKKQGYVRKNTGKSYDNVWENKKYLNVLRANKDVKLADTSK